MKKLFYSALMLVAAVGFTSCSSSDGGSGSESTQEAEIKALTGTYLNDVIYPTYTNLANSSEKLYEKLVAFNTKVQAGTAVTQGEVDAICDNYKEARNFWEESEAFLYGAAEDYNIDPHIDTWPLAVAELKSILSNDATMTALAAEDGIEQARSTILTADGQMGFHGIEFIFFRDGQNRKASFFNNNEAESYQDIFTDGKVHAKQECIYAKVVAGDVRDKTYQLECCWNSNADAKHLERVKACQASMGEDYGITIKGGSVTYGQDLLNVANGTSKQCPTWYKVCERILVDGCSNICGEVADSKLGQAYRCATDQAEGDDDPNYIESPYSYNSYTDFYGNIMSIQNALYGNYNAAAGKYATNSIMAYLYTYNASMAMQLESDLEDALDALKACQNCGKSFVQYPGNPLAGKAIEEINALDETLNAASSWILKNQE